MSLKDYYKILELSPGASVADIKKSFRRLALLYHPDRNFGSNIHEAKFKEIKEAYDVLSDTKQRQEYNSRRREQANEQRHSYSHSRSHSHSHSHSEPRSRTENKKTYSHPNAQTILNQTVEFRKRITVIDPERMNKKAVYHHIQKLLSIQNILILKHNNDPKINKDFIDEILNCARFLLFPEVEKICFQLTELAGTDNESYRKIYHFSRQSRLHTYWSRYKLLVAVIVALIFCLLIYLLSSN